MWSDHADGSEKTVLSAIVRYICISPSEGQRVRPFILCGRPMLLCHAFKLSASCKGGLKVKRR